MIERDGERYLLGNEAARFLGVSRPTFYHNVWPLLEGHLLPGRKHTYYRLVDLEPFCRVRVIKQKASGFFA